MLVSSKLAFFHNELHTFYQKGLTNTNTNNLSNTNFLSLPMEILYKSAIFS